ncbi:MAG: ATP-binding cassette, subfamily bacterial [Frankiales bacterium]|nr:ATP-binding cassette, subfamily bacterial [Frankiales bacterium]
MAFVGASGRLLLDGRDMSTIELRTYRRHLAIVPQEPLLFAGSVRDNITYGQATPLGDSRDTRFDAVLETRLSILADLVPFTPGDLPGHSAHSSTSWSPCPWESADVAGETCGLPASC